ncbi:methylated-DNA-[protein]-cysteine S-methyltransferase [Tenacibaculum sp. MAR_2009_124]|uniref:methylated-DNA--[protein]-cysteine S-methyltransferase n=1 Tax=Tenacibaculum sp. MAR_2009_124 TaxID=1250059 RepID=UPI000898E292|nr:methylated-DNA--[protein]-cysteine S-methyltransferase [Tenacibaculum sp. MAR_2009_124]SEC27848.1 methylated-DNA-[protein]-cysteine S-methyltransferase [Tenacibaculum sp. MAR_2009_124]
MSDLKTAYCKTPLGITKIIGDDNGVQSVSLLNEDISIDELQSTSSPLPIKNCIQQLHEYFEGTRKEFSVKLNPQGTEFQQKVWTALLDIPFGRTKSYLEQSKKLGDVKAIRAVASANGKNPVWILIPCHRVIGSDGSLTGYAGGIWRKKWLLEHESGSKQQTLF